MHSLRAQAQARRRAATELAREGSPPRVRGKPNIHRSSFLQVRITPACAGKTGRCRCAAGRSADHPRACGENCPAAKLRTCWSGSPPRMRGKPASSQFRQSFGRITPAHAGKTGLRRCERRRAWDHPRACGENPPFLPASCPPTGSPPRMRGKPRSQVSSLVRTRITPAHAGKTKSARDSW